MSNRAEKTHEKGRQPRRVSVSQKKTVGEAKVQCADTRPEALAHKELLEMANSSPQTEQTARYQAMADKYCIQNRSSEKSIANKYGLPVALKAGIKSLSGYGMEDVRVNYSSDKPFQLRAHAYARGTDIYLAPEKDKHLPHEAGHVVQQKRREVKSTLQMKAGMAINDDAGLESDADVMGAKALQIARRERIAMLPMSSLQSKTPSSPVPELRTRKALVADGGPIQLRKVGKFGMEAEVLNERFKMIALNEHPEATILADPMIVLEEFSLGKLGDEINVTLDNELMHETDITKERSFTVELVGKAVDAVAGDPEELLRMEAAWSRAGQFWKTNMQGARKVIGMVGEAVDWFSKNPHWEAPQFDLHKTNRNVDRGPGDRRLYWDGPGFFPYIDARTEDPPVSMQVTAGSTLLSLDAVNLATSHVLSGHAAPGGDQVRRAQETRDLGYEEQQPEAWALLKILRDYQRQSFNAWLARIGPKGLRPKRYQKEYISLMVRTSLSSVFDGMSEPGRNAFIQWVTMYGERGEGPIALELGSDPYASFFVAPAKKEPQANTISVAEVLVSIVNRHLPEDERDEVKTGDAFTQVTKDSQPAPLAGFGEIGEDRQDQLDKYGLDRASEMMRGVTGLIAENRAAKIRPLSEVPEVFRQLIAALRVVEDG